MSEKTVLSGMVYKIMDEQEISSTFTKKEIVVKTAGEYPQFILVQFSQDKIRLLDGLAEYDFVDIDYNLRGREWKDRFFVSIEGWKINVTKRDELVGNSKNVKTDETLPF